MPDTATSKPFVFSKGTLGSIVFIVGILFPAWAPALGVVNENFEKILEIVGAAILVWSRVSAKLPIKGIFRSPKGSAPPTE